MPKKPKFLPNRYFSDGSIDIGERWRKREKFFEKSIRGLRSICTRDGFWNLHIIDFYSDFRRTASIVMPLRHFRFASGEQYVALVFVKSACEIKEKTDYFRRYVFEKCFSFIDDEFAVDSCFVWVSDESKMYNVNLLSSNEGHGNYLVSSIGLVEHCIDSAPLSLFFVADINPQVKFIPRRGEVLHFHRSHYRIVLNVDLKKGMVHLFDNQGQIVSESLLSLGGWLGGNRPTLREKITIHDLQLLAGNTDLYIPLIMPYEKWKKLALARYPEGSDVDRYLREYSRNYRDFR